jgi:hypothetical protein
VKETRGFSTPVPDSLLKGADHGNGKDLLIVMFLNSVNRILGTVREKVAGGIRPEI